MRSVRVRSGGRGVGLAYEALYDVEALLAEPAYDLAAEAAFDVESRSATAVLFTSVVDLAAAELLRESMLRLGRRHRALLLNLEDPELRRLAAVAPETPAQAFAQVASLEIQLANRRLAFDRLRDRGMVEKLFDELGPRYAKRNGGYLRILKTGFRKGDNAPLALVSLLDQPEPQADAASAEPRKKSEKKEAKAA